MADPINVGASILSSFINVLIEKIASREFADFIKGRRIDDELLKKLKTIMRAVNGVLDDAEEKQITKPGVKQWLDDLKDAVYEADDLLDEIAYKALKLKMKDGLRKYGDQVKEFFSARNIFKKGIDEKLAEVFNRLEFLAKQKRLFGLRESIREKPSSQEKTTSLVDESGVYGRDEDKEAIIELLFSDDGNGDEIGVIPVVGMAGVGKTTLAKLVYNDNRVREWFGVRAWVCVSQEFDISQITKDILEEVTSVASGTRNENQLQLELQERLRGKRFLLVLDDVWKCSYNVWQNLHDLLKSGAQGSKILVTTRNTNVASMMRNVPTHYLKELTDKDCWSLFTKHAFDVGNSSIHSDLEEIGRKMVVKCKGLPLAVKTLGGLLRSNRNVDEWENILKSSLWYSSNDDILPALRLSYHYLPSHLKRCFAYCAIFPKDYEFEKDELILLWMAEGFLVDSRVDKEMEEVGEEYFNELVSRSFFQQSRGYRRCFVMHDLMNDLAMIVSGQFCSRLESEDSCKITRKTRHMSYVRAENDTSKKFEGIHEAKLLRTFILLEWSSIDNEVMSDFLQKFNKLRILSLSQYRSVTVLPNSIGYLKHLRYLNLSTASIESLPEKVCVLYNLQTLILHDCTHLAVLPDYIGNLKHLRYLDLSGTSITRLPESTSGMYSLRTLILRRCKYLLKLPTDMATLINLYWLDIGGTKLKEMPPNMGELKNLHILTGFIVQKDGGSNIKELGELKYLRGKLCILNLENVVNPEDALAADMKGKRHLKELELRWNSDNDNLVHQTGVLEQLQPHASMESLSIVGYGGTEFPNWAGDSSFSNIVSLKLSGCKHCSSLPPLGQLTALKELSIIEFGRIMNVGPEFYGSCSSMKKPFESLKILKFERLPEWHQWISYVDEEENRAFPLLEELYIRDCPKLTTALPSHLPCLTTLEIEGCLQLVASLPRAPAILKMKLKDGSRDVLLKQLPSGLHGLTIDRLNSQDSIIDQMGSFSGTLEEIDIRNHESLKCFPLVCFPKLKSFRITRCPKLESLSTPEATHENLASLSSLEIRECPNLVSFLKERFPALNLARLLLLGCSSVEAFPEEMVLPSTLISLKILDFQNLKCLNYNGLQHLTSLKELEIMSCPKLQSLPEEGLPSSLFSFSVNLCPLLERRCRRETGEDWPKISHIPHVRVSMHRIN